MDAVTLDRPRAPASGPYRHSRPAALEHCVHCGFFSSHLTRLFLQVQLFELAAASQAGDHPCMSTHQPVEVRRPRALEGLSRLDRGVCFSVIEPSVAARVADDYASLLASSLWQGSDGRIPVRGVRCPLRLEMSGSLNTDARSPESQRVFPGFAGKRRPKGDLRKDPELRGSQWWQWKGRCGRGELPCTKRCASRRVLVRLRIEVRVGPTPFDFSLVLAPLPLSQVPVEFPHGATPCAQVVCLRHEDASRRASANEGARMINMTSEQGRRGRTNPRQDAARGLLKNGFGRAPCWSTGLQCRLD